MASSSSVDVVENTSIVNTFISWKESVSSQRTEFFLQLQNYKWVLAVVGVVVDHPNMEFVIDQTFYGSYKRNVTSFGVGVWKRRCDVVAWLNTQISFKAFNNNNQKMLTGKSQHPFQVIMDAGDFSVFIDSEDAKASLVLPSGYIDAYSIPSKAQMVLKHGARNFDVKVEDGHFTHGWGYFVSEHEIQFGFVVKFHFRGCSTYETEIFDPRKDKMVYPWSNIKYHKWF